MKEILYDGWYYDVTEFIRRHPGGSEIMEFFTEVGEDATLAVHQFHNRSFSKVRNIMKSLPRRPATTNSDKDRSSETQLKNSALTQDFLELFSELQSEGMFEPSYFHVAYRLLEIIFLGVLGLYMVNTFSNPLAILVGCFVVSMAQGRGEWILHECGHYSFSGKPTVDRLIQSVVAGTSLGFSASWWRRHHNLHHAMTSRLNRDVDFDTLPLIVLNTKVVSEDRTKRHGPVLGNQKYFLPFNGLIAILYWQWYEAGLSLLQYRYLDEFLALGLHYYLVTTYLGFWTWLISTSITGLYLFGNFTLSHSFLPVTTTPTHWVTQSFVHTADIEQRPWCDWWMGYLNYQIEHHLFPTMPQFRNKLIVERVETLAKKHGLPYHVFGYREAAYKSFKNMVDIGTELRAH